MKTFVEPLKQGSMEHSLKTTNLMLKREGFLLFPYPNVFRPLMLPFHGFPHF